MRDGAMWRACSGLDGNLDKALALLQVDCLSVRPRPMEHPRNALWLHPDAGAPQQLPDGARIYTAAHPV